MFAAHQMLKTLVPGDAISFHTLEIQRIIRSWGVKSEIFVETVHPDLVPETHPIDEYSSFSGPENLLIFHFSQGTHLAEKVLSLPDKLVLIYHNITPEIYFRRVHHETWLSLIQGREQLTRLAEAARLGLADSDFNCRELTAAGCCVTGVLPIILDSSNYTLPSSRLVENMFRDPLTTFLFVGRVTPNKGHDRLLKFLYYYHKLDPSARLLIVGEYHGFEPYMYRLNTLIRSLRLEEVHFTGHVTQRELCTYYRLADVFLCFSDHEGFCVPLVESMFFDLPIIALRGTAIGGTLGDAGILVDIFDPPVLAEICHRLVGDNAFRKSVIESQQRQRTMFERERIARTLYKFVKPLFEEPV